MSVQNMSVQRWMSWEGGVDLVGVTGGAEQPNIIVHVARMVHTPVGSAPSGMILIQPDPHAAPTLMGFISADETVGGYFGPNIFAGTPFESAPVLVGSIDIATADSRVTASIEVAGKQIQSTLSGLGSLEQITRAPADMPPFAQMVLESPASAAALTIDGNAIDFTIPPVGISGGPAASWSPTGIYCR